MEYRPYDFEKLNMLAGTYNPSSIKARNNKSFAFWERALFQRCLSVFDFNLLPEWDGEPKDFMLMCLFRFGFLMGAIEPEFGRFMQPCSLSGYDFYYQPTKAILSNPKLNKEYTIGEDCELLKLSPDYMGAWDIIDYYAEKLSHLDNGINQALINSKFAWILGAKNKAAAQALKKIMDLVQQGEPLVVYDQRILNDATTKEEPWQFLDFGSLKDKYMTPEMLQDFSTILNQFDTEIGIPTLPYEKKERLVTSEAESKKVESIARCTIWLETMQSSLIKLNKLFNSNMSVSLRFNDGGDENESGKDNDTSI